MKKKISNKKETGNEKNVKTLVTVETGQTSPETIRNIELSMIACSPFNPRKYRTEEDLEELTKSIVNFGIIQPVTLRKKDDRYEIVCGERRYRASLMAELKTIPAIIKSYSDEEAMEITILENLQRKDINPVEEAASFGKLMEVRGYSIDDLVRQFGKTDKYIRSRLQLRSLTEEISELLVREEITLGIALELARLCPDTQKDIYREHLTSDDSYSWKHLQTKDFRKVIENKYSTDLSRYEFDKSECIGCGFNSSVYDLFADGNCGSCQNMECLRKKQAGYMSAEVNKLLKDKPDAGICVAHNSMISADVVNNFLDKGCEVYEMLANRLPAEPQKPVLENYATETDYQAAEASYEISLQRYNIHSSQIEEMVSQGKAQILVDVSNRKPELCYRVIPETRSKQREEEDTVEKLRERDKRYRELAFEKGLEEVIHYLKENPVPAKEFSAREKDFMYFILFSFLQRENYGKFGIDGQNTLSDEEKMELITFRSVEQENAVLRDFIIHSLLQTSGICMRSNLLLEFAGIHFPEKVAQIKEQCSETYRKRHEKIEERIRELQPFTGTQNVEDAVVVSEEQAEEVVAVPETVETEIPETFEEPDSDGLILYPGIPEQAQIGEDPEDENNEAFDLAYEEIAA